MRKREARTKFIHHPSCGAAFHFSQTCSETPPVTITYSPGPGGTGSAAAKCAAASKKPVARSRANDFIGAKIERKLVLSRAESAAAAAANFKLQIPSSK